MSSKIHLPITHLENSVATLESGNIYAIIAPYNLRLQRWLNRPFLHKLTDLKPVMLISNKPDQLLPESRRSKLYGINEWPDETKFTVFKARKRHFLRDREFTGALSLRSKHTSKLVLIDCNAEQFDLKTNNSNELHRSLSALHHWAVHCSSIVLLIIQERAKPVGVLPTLLSYHTELAGVTSWSENRKKQLIWQTYYWHSYHGVITHHVQIVEALKDKSLIARNVKQKSSSSSASSQVRRADSGADDEAVVAVVIVQSVILGADDEKPDSWVVAETAEACLQKALTYHATAIILSYESHNSPEEIIQYITDIRKCFRDNIVLFVREMDQQIRYSDESAFIAAGANAIIPCELTLARCQHFIELQMEQTRHTTPPPNSDNVGSRDIAQSTINGFLEVSAFVSAVQPIIEDARDSKLQHALIEFQHIEGQPPFDGINVCLPTRPLDLCTATGHCTYLFLYACRKRDIAETITRIFHLPVDDLFASEKRFHDLSEIEWALMQIPKQPIPTISEQQDMVFEHRKHLHKLTRKEGIVTDNTHAIGTDGGSSRSENSKYVENIENIESIENGDEESSSRSKGQKRARELSSERTVEPINLTSPSLENDR